MTKRLSDTSALKAQGIKEAGVELAQCRPSYYGPNEPNPLEPAYGSADYAVGAAKRHAEREKQLYSPVPFADPKERAEKRRTTGAGSSSLSSAVKVARGE